MNRLFILDKKDKNITFVITDMWDPNGDYISHALNADCGNGDSCFKALADLGPVYVIILGDTNSKALGYMEQGCKNLSKRVSKDYGIKWNDCYAWASDSAANNSPLLAQYVTDNIN
ncbi:MAG: hypothetical protein ABGY11_00590 [Candidatus Thioglobus sp.]